MVDDTNEGQPAAIAAVRYGMPVLDVRGAFLGTIGYVGTGESGAATGYDETHNAADARGRIGLVRLQACGRRDCDLFIAPANIAYVADDHVRLSITANEAISEARTTGDPR